MRAFFLRRLGFSLISLVGATFIVFSLSRIASDPILLYASPEGYGKTPEQLDAIKKKLGLDKPFFVQYIIWAGNAVQGDLGRSLVGERPVIKVIGEKFGNTASLIYGLYPMAGVIEGFRSALLGHNPMPWDLIGMGSITAVFLFVSGALYFKRKEGIFADVA